MPWTLWREYDPRLHRRGWLQLPTEVVGLEQVGPGEVRATVQTAAARALMVRLHGFRLVESPLAAEPVNELPAPPIEIILESEPDPVPLSRADLLEQARSLGIKGRTKMDTEALCAAIAEAKRLGP